MTSLIPSSGINLNPTAEKLAPGASGATVIPDLDIIIYGSSRENEDNKASLSSLLLDPNLDTIIYGSINENSYDKTPLSSLLLMSNSTKVKMTLFSSSSGSTLRPTTENVLDYSVCAITRPERKPIFGLL